MITAAEGIEQEAVIQATMEYLDGAGQVLGGSRDGGDGWQVAIRYVSGAEQVIYLTRYRGGWTVVSCRYAMKGEALPEAWQVA